MPEEMRVETMELCVTACEKFSNNNEVLPSVQPLVSWVTPAAPVPAASYTECHWGQANPSWEAFRAWGRPVRAEAGAVSGTDPVLEGEEPGHFL